MSRANCPLPGYYRIETAIESNGRDLCQEPAGIHETSRLSKGTPGVFPQIVLLSALFLVFAGIYRVKCANNMCVTMLLSTQSTNNDSAFSQASKPQIVLAHIPSLGTWTAYKVYSTLSFAESKREDNAAVIAEGLIVAKAPMPCKVLKILKKARSEVKKGKVS
jgi:hypothetical protein